MKFRLRYILAAAFTLIVSWYLGRATSYSRELSSVEEKHLLLAKNITNALELYTHDASALFAFLTTSAEQERWPRCATALAEALDFQHFAIIDSSGVLKKSLYPTEEDEAILPLGGFSPLKRLLSEGGR